MKWLANKFLDILWVFYSFHHKMHTGKLPEDTEITQLKGMLHL